MKQENNLLFIYGTLLQPGNEFSRFLKMNSRMVSKGKIEGRLYDIGNYPGAVSDADCGHFVYGLVVEMNDADKVLRKLDVYEGLGQSDCEYNRILVEVEVEDHSKKTCWVYLYKLSPGNKHLILGGDYLKYKHLGNL